MERSDPVAKPIMQGQAHALTCMLLLEFEKLRDIQVLHVHRVNADAVAVETCRSSAAR